ncbi:MAG: hypothetical protein AB1571_03410 [Nanoarchaeota archaeon]
MIDDKTNVPGDIEEGIEIKEENIPAEKEFLDIARDFGRWVKKKFSKKSRAPYKKIIELFKEEVSEKKKEDIDKEISGLVRTIQKYTHDDGNRINLEGGVNMYYDGKKPKEYSKEALAIRELNDLVIQYLTLNKSKNSWNELINKAIDPLCMRKGPVKSEYYPNGEPYAISAIRFGMGKNKRGLDNVSLVNYTCNETFQKEKGMQLKKSFWYNAVGTALLTGGLLLGIEHYDQIKNFYEHFIDGQKIKDFNYIITPLSVLLSLGGFGFGLKGYLNYRRHKTYDNRIPTLILSYLRNGMKNDA